MKKNIIFILVLYSGIVYAEKTARPTLEGRISSLDTRINSLETKVARIENSIDDIKDLLQKNNGNGKTIVESKPSVKITHTQPSHTKTTHVIRSPRTGCPGGQCVASEFNSSGDSDAKLYCNRMYAGIDEQQRACYARQGSSNDPVNSGILQY